MAIEAIRGCGYRKVNGLYLCGGGPSMTCDRLPYELVVCPTCGAGVKFSRGFQWLDWFKYAGNHEGCKEVAPIITSGTLDIGNLCPVCRPAAYPQHYGLLWVGEAYYDPETFIKEALEMGVSKRIQRPPKNLKLGETWILFAHIKACGERYDEDEGKNVSVPGVFYAFRPQRLELLIWQKDATEEKLAELGKKHFTPVIIPDGDVDHDPRTSLKPKAEERTEVFFESLRESITGGQK